MDQFIKFIIIAPIVSLVLASIALAIIAYIDSWEFARTEFDFSRVDEKTEENGRFFFIMQIWYRIVPIEVDQKTYDKFQEGDYMQIFYQVTQFWHKVRNARMLPYDAPLFDFTAGLHSNLQVPQVLH